MNRFWWCARGMVVALALSGGCAARPAAVTVAASRPTVPLRQLAAGGTHTCALTAAGEVWCWGDNRAGQTLPGGDARYSVPVRVTALRDVVEIAAGARHTCARRAEGAVLCWGGRSYPARFEAPRVAPEAVAGLREVAALDVGGDLACARSQDGRVACWDVDQPTGGAWQSEEVEDFAGSAQIAVGGSFACARRRDGAVRCRGDNEHGQLGGVQGEAASAVDVGGLRDATAIVAGDSHACAIRTDGSVVCWGSNDRWAEAPGSEPEVSTEAERSRVGALVPIAGLTEVVALTAGAARTCARRRGGETLCWGAFGTETVPSLERFGTFEEVAAGGDHACGSRASGELLCQGANDSGQLAVDGISHAPHATPVAVPALSDVVEVVAGARYTCARRSGGDVTCWGANGYGELGDGTNVPRPRLGAPILGLTDVVQLAGGYESVCAVRRDGGLACWGRGFAPRVGVGARGGPIPLVGAQGVVEAAVDGARVCARRGDGRLLCWEAGAPSAPVEVAGIADATGLGAGGGVTCAVRATGRVACWGPSVRGAARAGEPTLAAGVEGAVEVDVGEHVACARRRSGTVVCWNHSRYADARDAAPDDPRFIWTVAGVADATGVALGDGHLCMSQANGAVACQGINEDGQLGTGEVGPSREQAVATTGVAGARGVAAGERHACAWLASGRVMCWGANRGQLGTGEVMSASTPLPVLGLGYN